MPRTPIKLMTRHVTAADAPDAAAMPRRVDRRAGAELVARHFFPVSPRTLEVWPLTWRRVNGYAVCETAELLAEAQRRFDAAAPIRGGRKPKPGAPTSAHPANCANG